MQFGGIVLAPGLGCSSVIVQSRLDPLCDSSIPQRLANPPSPSSDPSVLTLQGPYMCGDKPQSGDFHVFEMLDQHHDIALSIGMASPLEAFPKLKVCVCAFVCVCHRDEVMGTVRFVSVEGSPIVGQGGRVCLFGAREGAGRGGDRRRYNNVPTTCSWIRGLS